MSRFLVQDPIIPRGFEGKIPDLSTQDPNAINDFYNKTQINITGEKIPGVQELIFLYTKYALSLAGYALMLALIYSGIRYIIAGSDEGQLTSAKKNLYWSIVGFTIVMFAYAIFMIVANGPLRDVFSTYAQTSNTPVGVIENIVLLISDVIKWILGIVGIVFLLTFLINGFRYLIGSGGEETEVAKKGILNAIIGIVIIMFSYAIAVFIEKTLKY